MKKYILHSRPGFTLVELLFSISFLAALVLGATISYVNILGIYNRAQGLTRTQTAARSAMDTLTRDLSRTDAVQAPTDATPPPVPVDRPNGVTGVRDYHCLVDSRSNIRRAYALLSLSSDNNWHLARMQDCTSLNNYQVLIDSPTWSDTAAGTGCEVLTISDSTRGTNAQPKVWEVTVRASHGLRNPCGPADANLGDTLAASTILRTHVVYQ